MSYLMRPTVVGEVAWSVHVEDSRHRTWNAVALERVNVQIYSFCRRLHVLTYKRKRQSAA
jgi:hypothetical protein